MYRLLIFILTLSTTLSAYDSEHNLSSLYTITEDTLDTFLHTEGKAYSRFKYGEQEQVNYSPLK